MVVAMDVEDSPPACERNLKCFSHRSRPKPCSNQWIPFVMAIFNRVVLARHNKQAFVGSSKAHVRVDAGGLPARYLVDLRSS